MEDTGWFGDKPGEKPGSEHKQGRVNPRSIRLTFTFEGDRVELSNVERLPMISPPQHGEPPEAGKQGGEWMILSDRQGRTVAWCLLHDPLRTRVEVHDPEAGPSLVVGPPSSGVFEVLLPDVADAQRA